MMLAQRTKKMRASPTLALAAKAKELAAAGHDVISLSVGEPDWDTFAVIKQAGIKAIVEGKTKYAPASGLPELRKAIARATNAHLKTNYQENDVTVTAGAKFIVFAALQALIDPGDEVIVPSPYWVSYPTMIELAEGKPVIVPGLSSHEFKMDAESLKAALSQKTKALILNSPCNPTGSVYTCEELKQLAMVLREYPRVVVISDDIYNRLVFTGESPAPHILQAAPDFLARTVVINGASKSFSMTGWRVGWALGPLEVIQAMSNYQSQSVSCASPFAQLATLEGLNHADAEIDSAVKRLERKRDRFMDGVNAITGLHVEKPGGAFYLWIDVSGLFGKSCGGKKLTSSSDFSELLLQEEKVVTVPGIEFGTDGFVRASYVVSEDQIDGALKRLRNFVMKLQAN